MDTARVGHCAVVLEDLVYVMAGFKYDSDDDQICYLQTVECCNRSTNQWREVPNLTNARRNAAAATACGKIIVVGGFRDTDPWLSGAMVEPTCEMFEPCQNQWNPVSSTKVPRAACGIVCVDDTLYVFGGQDEEGFLNSVECFDVNSNKWHEVDAPKPNATSFVQASLLKLPN